MTAALAPDEKNILIRLLPELVSLSPAARIEAIHQLVDSMQVAPVTEPAASAAAPPRQSLLDFAGAWNSMPQSAEELVQEIREARTFNRPEISLD